MIDLGVHYRDRLVSVPDKGISPIGAEYRRRGQRPLAALAAMEYVTIQQSSEEELLVDHGSLYPALQRLEAQGWITAKWGTSDNNRKARFYTLTSKGHKQLVRETGLGHQSRSVFMSKH